MKIFKHSYILLFSILFYNNSNAQCGFDIERAKLLQDPNYAYLEKKAEEKIQQSIATGKFLSTEGTIYTIPVVIHVLHLGEAIGTGTNISDAQIQSSIDNLNYFYSGQSPNSSIDFEVQFELAKRDPNCNSTTGINRIDASGVPNYSSSGVFLQNSGADQNTLKDLSKWPATDYLNIWIVSEIDNNNGGYGIQGYANFFNGSPYEGSVMMYTVFGYDPTNLTSWPLTINRDNSTVVHEVGHYFHLYHTFQGDNNGSSCPSDITVGVDSDGCADTETHKRHTSTCPTNNDCNSNNPYNSNTLNNIMSYFSCTDRLTNDQKTRVRAALENTSIVNSKGAIPPNLTHTAPTVAVCNTNSVSTNNSGIVSVELNGITFGSSTSAIDGGNIDNSQYCSGYFEIDTSVSNTLNVGLTVNIHQLGVWIDWNDDGDFNDDAEQQHLSEDIPTESTIPIVLSYPSSIPYDHFIRIRLVADLDDTYTGVGLIDSACYQSLVYGQSEDYSIYVQPGPITYNYNNGWSPGNPNGSATMNDELVIMAGNASISSDTQCNAVTVNAGASLTVDTGITLTANTITLNSTSQQYSSLILDGAIASTVNYERYVDSDANGRDLVSPPLTGQSFSDFYSNNTSELMNNGGTPNAQVLFGPFDNSANPGIYVNYLDNETANLNAGIGYRTATNSGSTLNFTGTVNTGAIPVTITDEPGNYGSWNLIGNPYPSYISFKDFYDLITDVDNSLISNQLDPSYSGVYGYDSDSGDGSIWTIWDFNNSTYNSDLIAPGQGFFVKSKSGGGMASFTNNMRQTGTSDDFITNNKNTTDNVALAKLLLTNNLSTYNTNIYFRDGNTRGLDSGYDTGAFGGYANGIFTNLIEDNTGVELINQSLPYEDMNDIVVPLGINAEQGVQISIELSNNSTLPDNINVHLEDNQTNNWILLNDGDYTFTPTENLSGTGRFFAHFGSNTLSVEDHTLNGLNIYTDESACSVVVKGKLSSNANASIFDVQGRLVVNHALNSTLTTNNIDVSALSAGIYIVDLQNGNQHVTKKVIIK